MEGRLTFLGTGTSMGVPTLGCGCASVHVGRSARPPPAAFCASAMADEMRDRVVLIDTGPDFREQALRNKLTRVDAVFYHPRPCRPHPGPRRPAAAELYGLSRRRTHSAFRHAGDRRDAAPHLRLHVFAAGNLSQPAPRAHRAARTNAPAVFGVEFRRVPVLHGEMEIPVFASGAPPI